MNRIAGRSGIALVLVLVLMGGLVFFVAEDFLEAEDQRSRKSTCL